MIFFSPLMDVFMWKYIGTFYPGMPFVKLFLAIWIGLPQFKGELIIIHFVWDYFWMAGAKIEDPDPKKLATSS